MEQSPGYREDIEDSIRRCEELLALSPLALGTSTSGLRRSFSEKEQNADTIKGSSARVKEEEVPTFSAQELWRRNMDLLVNGTTKQQERLACKSELDPNVNKAEEQGVDMFTSEPQGPHESGAKSSDNLLKISASAGHSTNVQGTGSCEEGSEKSPSSCPKSNASNGNNLVLESDCSGASLEWVMNGSCQDSEVQFKDSSQFSQKSGSNSESCDRLHVVLPLDTCSTTQSMVTDTRSNDCTNVGTKARSHAVEVTATRILDSSAGDVSSRTSPCIAESEFKEDDSFVYSKHSHRSSLDRLHSESEEIPSHSKSVRHERFSESLQVSTPDGSGVSRLALGVTWDASDRFTSSDSEHRINMAGFAKQQAEHMYIHRQVLLFPDGASRFRWGFHYCHFWPEIQRMLVDLSPIPPLNADSRCSDWNLATTRLECILLVLFIPSCNLMRGLCVMVLTVVTLQVLLVVEETNIVPHLAESSPCEKKCIFLWHCLVGALLVGGFLHAWNIVPSRCLRFKVLRRLCHTYCRVVAALEPSFYTCRLPFGFVSHSKLLQTVVAFGGAPVTAVSVCILFQLGEILGYEGQVGLWYYRNSKIFQGTDVDHFPYFKLSLGQALHFSYDDGDISLDAYSIYFDCF